MDTPTLETLIFIIVSTKSLFFVKKLIELFLLIKKPFEYKYNTQILTVIPLFIFVLVYNLKLCLFNYNKELFCFIGTIYNEYFINLMFNTFIFFVFLYNLKKKFLVVLNEDILFCIQVIPTLFITYMNKEILFLECLFFLLVVLENNKKRHLKKDHP